MQYTLHISASQEVYNKYSTTTCLDDLAGFKKILTSYLKVDTPVDTLIEIASHFSMDPIKKNDIPSDFYIDPLIDFKILITTKETSDVISCSDSIW